MAMAEVDSENDSMLSVEEEKLEDLIQEVTVAPKVQQDKKTRKNVEQRLIQRLENLRPEVQLLESKFKANEEILTLLMKDQNALCELVERLKRSALNQINDTKIFVQDWERQIADSTGGLIRRSTYIREKNVKANNELLDKIQEYQIRLQEAHKGILGYRETRDNGIRRYGELESFREGVEQQLSQLLTEVEAREKIC